MAHVLPDELMLQGLNVVLQCPPLRHRQFNGRTPVAAAAEHVSTFAFGGVRLDRHRVSPTRVMVQLARQEALKICLQGEGRLLAFCAFLLCAPEVEQAEKNFASCARLARCRN